MKPVLVFRHISCEGPGYLADFLAARDIPMHLVRIDEGEGVPREVDRYSALVFMGGPMSVNDPIPWISDELALIRKAHQQDMPILGHCLGGQLISKALGGKVVPNRVKEIGWYWVERVDGVSQTNWPSSLPPRFEAFHWHGETFSIPAGATPLLRSEYCETQAFVKGHTLALQCHLEMTVEMVQEWVNLYSEQLSHPSASVQSKDEILSNLVGRVAMLQSVADRLYSSWIEGF